MLNGLQYRILRACFPGADAERVDRTPGVSKLRARLTPEVLGHLAGMHVIDFGCGTGEDAIELARLGAARVTGIDIRCELFAAARRNAEAAGVSSVVTFAQSAPEAADLIVSLDAFEHFSDPPAVLETMASLLKPGGAVFICFGPPWYHPYGGHLFSVFPWAHLFFSESALIRWRSDFKTDGATRFGEVAGGLNQMTIGRFEKLAAASAFEIVEYETIPIRMLRPLHNRLTREFTTSVVRCMMRKRSLS